MATLLIKGGGAQRLIEFNDLTVDHDLPVLGLASGTDYRISVVYRDKAGNGALATTNLAGLTTAPPANLQVNVLEHRPELMEPGYTIATAGEIFDQNGRIVYSGQVTKELVVIRDAERIQELGDILGTDFSRYTLLGLGLSGETEGKILAKDLLGNAKIIADFTNERLGLVHHDLILTDDNTLLTFGRTSFVASAYPKSETDPTPTSGVVVEDNPLIEVGLDGKVLNTWYMRDIIDPRRAGYDAWNILKIGGEGLDWTHMNTVIQVPGEDAFIVSSRHQDAVFKFTRGGELVWILGNHENWSPQFQQYLLDPVGDNFSWQYHQHTPGFLPNGDLMMFDNGNWKASPYDGTVPVPHANNWSRGVTYRIDEDAKTVSQVWEYDAGRELYSQALGDTDLLPKTGNILLNFGFITYEGGVTGNSLGKGKLHTHIIEVTPDESQQKVFEVEVYDKTGANYRSYRAERVPSLYNTSVAETSLVGSAIGTSGSERFLTGTGNHFVLGLAGADTMFGRDGNDTIDGAGDADSIDAAAGDDRIYGGGGADTLTGGVGNDTATGGNGNDLLSGRDGNDSLAGDVGDDIIKGNNGDDTLSGGRGNDTLTGATGRDLFVFDRASSTRGAADVVADFRAGEDMVDLRTFVAAGVLDSLEDIQGLMEPSGSGTLLRLSAVGGEDVTFAGVAVETLSDAGNFLL